MQPLVGSMVGFSLLIFGMTMFAVDRGQGTVSMWQRPRRAGEAYSALLEKPSRRAPKEEIGSFLCLGAPSHPLSLLDFECLVGVST